MKKEELTELFDQNMIYTINLSMLTIKSNTGPLMYNIFIIII
jgi:hypothetical protein